MEFRVAQWKPAPEPRPGEVALAQARAATREDSAALDWETARRAMLRPYFQPDFLQLGQSDRSLGSL
jgi:hypothetical protein